MTTTETHDEEVGTPVPLYFCMYRGHTLHVLQKGQMREALDWIAGRDIFAAVVADIDGVRREVARGTEPAPVL